MLPHCAYPPAPVKEGGKQTSGVGKCTSPNGGVCLFLSASLPSMHCFCSGSGTEEAMWYSWWGKERKPPNNSLPHLCFVSPGWMGSTNLERWQFFSPSLPSSSTGGKRGMLLLWCSSNLLWETQDWGIPTGEGIEAAGWTGCCCFGFALSVRCLFDGPKRGGIPACYPSSAGLFPWAKTSSPGQVLFRMHEEVKGWTATFLPTCLWFQFPKKTFLVTDSSCPYICFLAGTFVKYRLTFTLSPPLLHG